MNLIEVNHLSKSYDGFRLQDISFSLPAGFIMGYVGQNGAGKTTTLNAMMHLIVPDSGDASIDGVTYAKDPLRYRDSIGYIGDASFFPADFTAMDIENILRNFYPSFRRDTYREFLKKWNLSPQKKIKDFSRGMKVKLMFAAVLSRDTKVLILDEATNGLDPMMRKDVLDLLQEYICDGSRSIIFSTHIMEDLQDIADYIFFIDNGEKIFFEPKDELAEKFLLVKGGPEDLTDELKAHLSGIEKHAYGFTALFSTDSDYILPAALTTERPTIDQIIIHQIQERRH